MYWDMHYLIKIIHGINNLEVGEYSKPLYYEDPMNIDIQFQS